MEGDMSLEAVIQFFSGEVREGYWASVRGIPLPATK
jgi:hypothetical protein